MAIGERQKRCIQNVVLFALVLLIIGVSSVTAVLTVNSRGSQPRQLTETDRKVRAIVSKSPAAESNLSMKIPTRVVVIPEELLAMYQKDPDVILDALMRVVQEAKPVDSVKAAAFALDLPRRGSGLLAIRQIREWSEGYDEVQEGQDKTRRQKLIELIQRWRYE